MKNNNIKKVLVIGSGPIIIGQAAEFDYAGVQACTELNKNGIEVILINSNPATIMTDKKMGKHIYIENLSVENIEQIIIKEKPDSILPNMGGQTGLNLAFQLHEKGILNKYKINLLGTSIESIKKAEDRKLFKETMNKINQPCIPSKIVNSLSAAKSFAKTIGFPLIIRPAYTLGGLGGGIAHNDIEFETIVLSGLRHSMVNQILVEKDVSGWKEIEFEVLRDSIGNTVTVCNMENLDPVGVHTGDSIVVSPCQTLSDKEIQMLRTASINIINELKIEGGCNVQYALSPTSFEYRVIEVNPRVSRSSALASKATGYPIARISTLISIGYTLDEISNPFTNNLCCAYEPSMDYVAVKISKFPFEKFLTSKDVLGTQMQATGEVLGLGNCFKSALLKAYSSLDEKNNLFHFIKPTKNEYTTPSSKRLLYIFHAIGSGISIDTIYKSTKIDKYFLNQIKQIVDFSNKIKLTPQIIKDAKQYGFSDEMIGFILNKPQESIQDYRLKNNIIANFKKIDTCAGEFKCKSNYFYSTYDDINETNIISKNKKIIVIGSGPIKIGQGIEFDYCSVHAIWKLQQLGYDAIMINSNPETLSTDYDLSNKLFFEPITNEYVDNIIEKEKPYGVMIQFGGGTAINLAEHLSKKGVKLLGCSYESINNAEDRKVFNTILNDLNIPQAKGTTVFTNKQAIEVANKLSYPVLVRPSYVLGGQGMAIAYNDKELTYYIDNINSTKQTNPILIDKYLKGIEYEIDAITDGEDILIPAIMEQIELSGVHSGDSICVLPTIHLDEINKKQIITYAQKLAKQLKIIGIFNIQFVVYDKQVYVIEVNPRSSRTIPYVSKVTSIPIIDLAIDCIFGKKLSNLNYGTGLYKNGKLNYYGVKAPVFSFNKIKNSEVFLSPMMKSTGEVLGIDKNYHAAVLKAFASAGVNIENKTAIFISENRDNEFKNELVNKYKKAGFKIIEANSKEALTYVKQNKIGLLVNSMDEGKDFELRRTAIDYKITTFTSLYTADAYIGAVLFCNNKKITIVDIVNL